MGNENKGHDQEASQAWQAGGNEYAKLGETSPDQPPTEIEQRKPVVDVDPDANAINREWALVTEAIRRDALAKPEVQGALVSFVDQPIDQATAAEMLVALAGDQRVSRLAHRAGSQLDAFLQLPEVPESAIAPDITHAPHL